MKQSITHSASRTSSFTRINKYHMIKSKPIYCIILFATYLSLLSLNSITHAKNVNVRVSYLHAKILITYVHTNY